MTKVIENKKEIKIIIERDDYGYNPREDSDLSHMICFSRRYNLGDSNPYRDWENGMYDSLQQVKHHLTKYENAAVILPLYLYDHSGITINTTGFHCSWDSYQVGFIYITDKDLKESFANDKDKAKEFLINEVKNYDEYIRGNSFIISIEEINRCQCCGAEKTNEINSYGILGTESLKAEIKHLQSIYKEAEIIDNTAN